MTRILLAGAAACALTFGVASAAQARPGTVPGLASAAPTVQATDVSAARKKAKRGRASRGPSRVSSGASKAGTGGGAEGDSGAGAATGAQTGTPRGNPAAPTR